VLSAFVVVLGFVGLTPELAWVPEVPLVAITVLVPLVGYSVTGFLAERHSRRIGNGVLAGALAGVVSGLAGGLSFVFFGKSLLNLPVGVVLGCLAGAACGAVGAIVSARSRKGRDTSV
jgi:MFS family permease